MCPSQSRSRLRVLASRLDAVKRGSEYTITPKAEGEQPFDVLG